MKTQNKTQATGGNSTQTLDPFQVLLNQAVRQSEGASGAKTLRKETKFSYFMAV